jgi:DNA-binding SARP family transcriptional activator
MIELRTLGTLEVRHRGEPGPGPNTLQSKRLVLLAYLAAAPAGGFRRRDTLLGLFWPELDHEHARGSLRQALHTLRKALGDCAIVTRGESEIGLDPTVVTSDVRALEAHLADGDPVVALSHYRGDFLEGVFVADASPELEEWISAERLRLRRVAAKAAWAAAERPSGRGETGQYVRRAVLLSGDDEAALRRGIALLDRMGDRAAAAALFEEFAHRVARDLDVEPSVESQAAMQAVRTRKAIPNAPEAPSPAPAAAAALLDTSPPTHPHPRRRFLIGAGIGILVTLTVAAVLGLRRPTDAPARSSPVAIVPFRAAEADSSLAWLHEGIVELLAIRLSGPGGLALTNPSAVLATWNRASPSEGLGAPQDLAREVAGQVGAARFIEGSVAGTSRRITITARLSATTGTDVFARAVVEGSTDSLPLLVDRLATQLLVQSAGLSGAQFASLTRESPPAIRAFLEGRSAFRQGRMDRAAQSFVEATVLDSTFALAGWYLARAAGWAGRWTDRERGYAIAIAGREQLGPADRALLDAQLADRARVADPIGRWNAVVTAFPERPEAWYGLGQAHYSWGALSGEARPLERADEAFRRGWLLDSVAGARDPAGQPVAEATPAMVKLAHMRGDTAAVLRLAATALAHDSTTILAYALKWHRALVTSDAARVAFWEANADLPQRAIMWIDVFVVWSGVGVADLPKLIEVDKRHLRAYDPGYSTFAFTAMALNGGRPSEVPPGAPVNRLTVHTGPRSQVRNAMWWDADTLIATEAVRQLTAATNPPPSTGMAAREQVYNLCTLGEWGASRGDYAAAATASRQLRSAPFAIMPDSAPVRRYAGLCVALLDAMHASGLRLPGARARIATADSVARASFYAVCCGEAVSDANLQLARLWEVEGDIPRALAAVRRGAGPYGDAPLYLVTFLREEGRLAALTGDTTAAVRAYQHYLAIRFDPEPSLQPAVDSVRAALAALARSR